MAQVIDVNILENQQDIDRRIKEESQPIFFRIDSQNQTFGGSTLVKTLSGGGVVYPGSVMFVKKIIYHTTRELLLTLDVGSGAPTGFFQYRFDGIQRLESDAELPNVGECSSIVAIATRTSASDGDTAFAARVSVVGIKMTKGYNLKSNRVVKLEGDSNLDFSALSATTNPSLLPQDRLIAYMNSRGWVSRAVNKAKGSTDSTQWVAQLKSGFLTITETKGLRVSMFGTNDVVKAWAANGNNLTQPQKDALIAIFIANLTIMVQDFIQKADPDQQWLILGAPPIYNTVQEDALYQLRNAERNLLRDTFSSGILYGTEVSPITTPENKIYFLPLGATDMSDGIFPANSYDNYVEKTGNALHLTDTGGWTLATNKIIDALTLQNIR